MRVVKRNFTPFFLIYLQFKIFPPALDIIEINVYTYISAGDFTNKNNATIEIICITIYLTARYK